MPSAAPRPCTQPLCRRYAMKGARCEEHQRPERSGYQTEEQRKEYDRQRGPSSRRGYGTQWRRVRDLVLAEEPLCRPCQESGRVTAAAMVDHDVPLAQGGTHARSNLVPMCWPCHGRKTRADGSYGRPRQAACQPGPVRPATGGARSRSKVP